MSATSHAVRVGLARGWTEFRLSLRSPEDIAFYVLWGLGALLALYLNRAEPIPGTGLTYPSVMLPGVIAAFVVFGGIIGPAYALAIEREDGTLLRAKAAPHGISGYVAGQVVLQALGVLPLLLVLLVPSALLFDGVMHRGAVGWLAATGFIVLGLAATLPIGMIIGSLARKPNHVTTWGLLPVLGLTVVSGVFVPLQAMWGWIQVVAQVFPTYWLGAGMRWAFLPDAAAAAELTGAFRPLEAVVVIGLWGVAGLAVAPRVLRRMARKESGSAVETRRAERMQRIG